MTLCGGQEWQPVKASGGSRGAIFVVYECNGNRTFLSRYCAQLCNNELATEALLQAGLDIGHRCTALERGLASGETRAPAS